MSYDFAIEIDTGGEEPHRIEPFFDDRPHPALAGDGIAGTAVLTATGYARCGNYTSNVSGIWTRCLTAAMERVPEACAWAGDEARAFNARGAYFSRLNPVTGERERVPMAVETDRLRLADLAGKPCSELVPVLRAAVEWGAEHIRELHELDPANGWGDADGAVTYLWDIQRACEEHPAGRLYLNY